MTPEIKKLIIEVPGDLHRKFKAIIYEEGKTIKEIIRSFIEEYVKDTEKNKTKKNK